MLDFSKEGAENIIVVRDTKVRQILMTPDIAQSSSLQRVAHKPMKENGK